MAGGSDIKLTGWKKLKALLNPTQFSTTFDKNIAKATAFNAAHVRKEIRARMKEAIYEPNAKLTILLKGSSKPLIDDADLFNAVTSKQFKQFSWFVGVLRQAKGTHGEDLYNIAFDLHEGMTIPVTAAMRHLFVLLYEATQKVGGRDEHGRFLAHQAKVTPEHLTGRARELFEQMPAGTKIFPLSKDTVQIVTKARQYLRVVFADPSVLKFIKANWAAAAAASFKGLGL